MWIRSIVSWGKTCFDAFSFDPTRGKGAERLGYVGSRWTAREMRKGKPGWAGFKDEHRFRLGRHRRKNLFFSKPFTF
jgi:hypothetical protein